MTAPHPPRCVHGIPAWICRTCSPEDILTVRGAERLLDDDPLVPARGCVNGALLGMVLWIAFFAGLALLVAWWSRQ